MKKFFIILFCSVMAVTVSSQNVLNKLGLTSSSPAAYSLRLLSSSYNGKAINVRRSNDNSTQDIGFTSNGDLDTASLKTFVGSNSGYIAAWYDQSANGRNAVQTSTGSQPAIVISGVIYRKNGQPTLYFNNQKLSTANFSGAYSGAYTFAVCAGVNSDTQYPSFATKTSGNLPSPIDCYGNNLLYGDLSNYHTVNFTNTISAASGFAQWIFNASASGANTYYNGASNGSGSGISFTDGTSSPIIIGSRSDGVTQLNGWVSEVVSFNSVLSNTDIGTLQTNQVVYYSISIHSAPTITNFSNITKTSFDAAFNITAPTTNSSGAFTYSSSNTAVATISGTTVTIVAAGTTTITATEAADATYSSGTITATLTVNSVTIITKNGQITSSGSAYINKNGAIGGSYGVNKYGQILATKTAGNGLTAATASTSAYAIKQAYPSSTDGYYWIANANINGGAAFQIYADMTTNGGGWTLILQNAYSNSSWTYANSVLLNQTSPKYTSNNSGLDVSYDYSIISWADYIKSSSSGFQYMIDSYQRGQYGGIFTANAAYSFVSTTNANSNITNNQWFSGLGYNNNNGIGPRMPWWVNSQGYITTSDTGTGSWWGSLVAGESGWNPSPLLSNHNPSYIIWYWVR